MIVNAASWNELDVKRANESYARWIDSLVEALAEGIRDNRYPHLVSAIRFLLEAQGTDKAQQDTEVEP